MSFRAPQSAKNLSGGAIPPPRFFPVFAAQNDVHTMSPVSNPMPILVVDDDLPTQKLLETLVKRQGLVPQIVSNGAEAIACLRGGGEFACVILDLMMPELGGYDVIDFVAAERREVPIIVCTAAGMRSTEGLNSGVVRAIVRKPFDIDELAAIVTALAHRKR